MSGPRKTTLCLVASVSCMAIAPFESSSSIENGPCDTGFAVQTMSSSRVSHTYGA
jgi:hypothetical protein